MLISGLVPAIACGAVLVTGAVILSTSVGISAGLGVVLASSALAVVPGLLRLTRTWSPGLVLLAALLAYSAVMSSLWWVYGLVSRLSWIEPEAVGVGVGVAAVAWSAGVIRAMPWLRQYLYGDRPLPGRP